MRISRDWVLTAHHVVDAPELAARFYATRFGYLFADLDPEPRYYLDPSRGFFCSDDGLQGPTGSDFDLDYAFVRLTREAASLPPFDENVVAVEGAPAVGSLARIPQFRCEIPFDHPQECGMRNNEEPRQFPYQCSQPLMLEVPCGPPEDTGNFTVCDNPHFEYVYHRASTIPGCSGTPIFNAKWELVGVHTHSYSEALPSTISDEDRYKPSTPIRYRENWGTRIGCIVRDAVSRGFDFAQIPCLMPLADKYPKGRKHEC